MLKFTIELLMDLENLEEHEYDFISENLDSAFQRSLRRIREMREKDGKPIGDTFSKIRNCKNASDLFSDEDIDG